jgi:phospholipid/cholesterol/gamma-HCH transport system ATP-binding protein
MIHIEDLTVVFEKRKVLDSLSFDIPDDQITVVMGKSGIGKSVLLKAITGLVKAKGSIKIDGEEVLGVSVREQQRIRSKVGLLLQNGGLLDSLTVFDNIAFPLRYHKTHSEEDILTLVNKYSELVDIGASLKQYPRELSGGLRKRAALARAIVQQPQYLFYDEPTAGLDPGTSGLVEILIRRVKEELKVSTLVVTHDVDMVYFLGERIALLGDGKIQACMERSEALKEDSLINQQFLSLREKLHLEHGYTLEKY